jgi:uncharacterized membrane protein (UPF0136 family)
LSLPSLREAFAGGARTQPVLPNYRRQRSTLERVLKHGGFLVFCIALGFFYGFFYTLFPPQLLVYLVIPILFLALLVIWALPDTDRAPTRLLIRLFFAFFVAMVLWPNYLAIQLPGLPWMTLRRLIAFPMVGIALICYSTSSRFRTEIAEVLRATRPLGWMIGAFTLVQLLVIFWSAFPFQTLNYTLNYWFAVTSVFFVGAWALTRERRSELLTGIIIGTALFLCLLAALEYRNQAVLWAGHIPSFLQVQDEVMNRYLTAAVRDAQYRAVATFSVSLAFAEYLAIATPFIIHKLMKSRGIGGILAWGVADLALLAAINLTQSRLGILGWITAHALYGCIWAFKRWRDKRADLIAPAVSLVYPAGAILFFIGMFTVPAIRNRTIGGGSTGFSDQARQVQFDMLWPKMFANPFGYGGGRSGEVLGYRLPGGLLTVDSYVITILLDYGVIGFSLFAGALVYAAAKMIQLAWRPEQKELDLALPLACALVVAIQVRLVLSQSDNIPLLYMLMGMAAALVWRAKNLPPGARAPAAG